MNTPEKTLELEFTILEFHSNYVISRIREEIVFRKEHLQKLLKICSEHFEDQKFAYISKRDNVYNVDPTIYHHLKIENKNLFAIAIASERASSINMAHFEKSFTKVKFEIFTSLGDAVEWTQEILK